jgi:hypothetical protein
VKIVGWARRRIAGAFNSWAERLLVATFAAVGVLVWRLLRPHVSDNLTVPMRAVAAALGAAVAIVIVLVDRIRIRGSQVQWTTDLAASSEQLRAVATAYSENLLSILYAFRQVVDGEIADVSVKEWIEAGILAPARDLIRERQTGDVRLSILMPLGDVFVMAFAAGHTLENKTKFRLSIDDHFGGRR